MLVRAISSLKIANAMKNPTTFQDRQRLASLLCSHFLTKDISEEQLDFLFSLANYPCPHSLEIAKDMADRHPENKILTALLHLIIRVDDPCETGGMTGYDGSYQDHKETKDIC